MAQTVRMGVEGDLGKKNFSTYMIDDVNSRYGLHGYGSTAREAIEDTYASMAELRELAASRGESYPELELTFVFDVGALFSYYPYLNMTAVAAKMGINASLMRKYASGVCKPSKGRLAEIQSCIHTISTELNGVSLG